MTAAEARGTTNSAIDTSDSGRRIFTSILVAAQMRKYCIHVGESEIDDPLLLRLGDLGYMIVFEDSMRSYTISW